MIKHIFKKTDGTFREVTWTLEATTEQTANPVLMDGETLRFNGDEANVPNALKDEIIASEPVNPDWQYLTDSIPVDVAIILDSHNSFLSKRLFRLESHPELWEGANDKLFGYWNTPNPPSLTTEQRTEMNAALTAANIPAVVNSDNTLSYSA